MKARLAALSPRARIALAAGAVVLYGLAAWFLVVAPRQSEAATLSDDLAAAELRLIEVRTAAARPGSAPLPAADVLRLAKAMPSSTEQASLVLELDRLVKGTGATLVAIAPEEATVDGTGATLIPVTVTVSGSYNAITKFLRKTRALVGVRGGKVHATGRLFTVRSVELSESSTKKFPHLDATITLSAYAYDGPIVPPTPPTPVPAQDDTASTGATAAGATP